MFKKIALGTVIFLVLFAFVGSYWVTIDSKAKLEAIQERFRESGAPMTMAEALPEPVAAEMNAAPLYLELETLLKEYNFSDEIDEKLITPSDYEVDFSDIYYLKLSDAEWQLVEEVLQDERLVEQLELIQEIAARPYFQPDWKFEEGPNMRIPEVGVARRVSEYLLILAAQAVRSGDFEAANTHLSQVLAVSNHFDQSPTLISYLTGIANRGMASSFLEAASRTAEAGAIFDPQMWIRTSHNYWNRSLDSERLGMGKVIFEAIIDGDLEKWEQLTGEPAPAKFRATRLSVVTSYFRYDYVYYLEYFEATRFSKDPYYVSYTKRFKQLEEDVFNKNQSRHAHILSRILIPSLAKMREKVFQSDTQNVVNHAALQLARYQRDTGMYPEILGALVPDYFETVPVDLFNGESLIYRKEAAGFALYSVGPNLVNDGGVTNEFGSADDEHGDVIWAGAGSTLIRLEDD